MSDTTTSTYQPATSVYASVHLRGDVAVRDSQETDREGAPYVAVTLGSVLGDHLTLFAHDPEILVDLARSVMAASITLRQRIFEAQQRPTVPGPTDVEVDAAFAEAGA